MNYQACINEALDYFKVSKSELFSEMRALRICFCRFVLYRAFLFAGNSTTWVGRFFNRDHSTIMHGIKRLNPKQEEYAYYLYLKYADKEQNSENSKTLKALIKVKELYNSGKNPEQIAQTINADATTTEALLRLMKNKYKPKSVPDYKHYVIKTIYI